MSSLFSRTLILQPFLRTKMGRQALQRFVASACVSLFRYGLSSTKRVFWAYQPDAYADFDRHPYFTKLLEKFALHNSRNNSGDIARLWSLMLNVEHVMEHGVPGNFAELGVWRGNTAAVLAHFARRYDRRVHLFDTFAGFPSEDLSGIDFEKTPAFGDTSIPLVKGVLGDDAEVCELIEGVFPESIDARTRNARYSVVSLDCDLYKPMQAGLAFFFPRLEAGGIMFLHDYSSGHWEGARKAIDEFIKQSNVLLVLMPDKSGSAFFRKSGPATEGQRDNGESGTP